MRAITAKAERIVMNVRSHWESGRNANDRQNAGRNPLRGAALADELGVNGHTLRKQQRFARLYREGDLKRLLALRRPAGLPLHWGHVVYLITIEDRSTREEWQNRVCAHGWSAPRLAVELARKRGNTPTRGGRPVQVPSDVGDALSLLSAETQRWRSKREAICQPKLFTRLESRRSRKLRDAVVDLTVRLSEMRQEAQTLRKRLLKVIAADEKLTAFAERKKSRRR